MIRDLISTKFKTNLLIMIFMIGCTKILTIEFGNKAVIFVHELPQKYSITGTIYEKQQTKQKVLPHDHFVPADLVIPSLVKKDLISPQIDTPIKNLRSERKDKVQQILQNPPIEKAHNMQIKHQDNIEISMQKNIVFSDGKQKLPSIKKYIFSPSKIDDSSIFGNIEQKPIGQVDMNLKGTIIEDKLPRQMKDPEPIEAPENSNIIVQDGDFWGQQFQLFNSFQIPGARKEQRIIWILFTSIFVVTALVVLFGYTPNSSKRESALKQQNEEQMNLK